MPTSNEWCSNGFDGDWKRNIVVAVMNMIEVGVTSQRNIFSEIKIVIKCNIKIMYKVWWCDAMTNDVHREETSKSAALSGCTYNDEICFVRTEPKFIVCHPARDITETVTKLFKGKISVCCR